MPGKRRPHIWGGTASPLDLLQHTKAANMNMQTPLGQRARGSKPSAQLRYRDRSWARAVPIAPCGSLRTIYIACMPWRAAEGGLQPWMLSISAV